MSFRLERPRGRPAPVVVEVPHAGTLLPAEIADTFRINNTDVLRDADLYVHELFARAPMHGAVFLWAEVSRYVVDLNRFEHDLDPAIAPAIASNNPPAPRGVFWRETTEGRPVHKRPLLPAEVEARLDRYYRPYHRALAAEIALLRERFGQVILVCGHSMPSTSRATSAEPARRRADVVPGTRGRSTASGALIDLVDTHFRSAGLSVRHDDPYRGGATPARWGRPHEGIHAIQIELNRALYMDEQTFARKTDAMQWLASLCEELVARLCELEVPSDE